MKEVCGKSLNECRMVLFLKRAHTEIACFSCVVVSRHSSKDYLSRLAEGSTNVDGSGNFSIQVLRAALKNRFDLDLINVQDKEVLSQFGDITNMEGFIAHKDAHWFAIRKINGNFWNLNSMEERPSTISHFDLATKIAGYQKSGCTFTLLFFPRDACCLSSVISFISSPSFFRYCVLRTLSVTSVSSLYLESSTTARLAGILVERRRFGQGKRKCNQWSDGPVA
jgi:Josephin